MSVTDILEIAFLVFGGIGAAGVVLHFAGYIPRPYRDRLEATETTLATNLQALPVAIGTEVENALVRVTEKERAAVENQANVLQASVAGHIKGALGNEAVSRNRVNAAISEAILGPALPILRQFAPGLADMLEESPQLVDVVINNPLFQKYVAPRINQYLGNAQATGSADVSGWGT